MARKPLTLSTLAAAGPDDIPELDLNVLVDYEPPPLTTERLILLNQRRAQVAGAAVPKGLRGMAALRVTEAIRVARSMPPVPITYDVSQRTWRLLEKYSYTHPTHGYTLTVSQGYAFDLSSIPRPLWWLIAPNELSIIAPLFHDWLYDYRGQLPGDSFVNPYRTFTRRETDDLFLHLMEAEGVAKWRRMAAYSAVRAAGGIYWDT